MSETNKNTATIDLETYNRLRDLEKAMEDDSVDVIRLSMVAEKGTPYQREYSSRVFFKLEDYQKKILEINQEHVDTIRALETLLGNTADRIIKLEAANLKLVNELQVKPAGAKRTLLQKLFNL